MKSTVETKIIELVKLGHELAKELHCAESAALVSDLASQLEVQLVRSNALAAENAGLKRAAEFATAPDMWVEQPDGMLDYLYVDWYVDVLKSAMETPATDGFLAEVLATGVDAAIEHLLKKFEGTGHIGVPVMALEWLAQELRKGGAE
ncbi:hypothetical protein I5679_14165 [Citrobacter koseri]|uniref:hypothetical protein n=1 Tax=Citrobacter koseri TaxID=545 RepID=UPI0018FFC91E|nr:hypothetical protein [Citrobacter koseri]MBJ9818028.1 hypothetical protein [Citrobacter koseri]HBK3300230.1 hypothetical protein [Citrobacter koseri]